MIIPWLLAAGAMSWAGNASADPPANAENPIDRPLHRTTMDDIVVFGHRDSDALADIRNEDELSEEDIASYAQDNVGDLLDHIGAGDKDGEDRPVVLVNGRPVVDMSEVTSLPTEALRRVQLAPRGFAAQLGERPDRRVINLVVKRKFRQATFSLQAGMATAGGGHSGKAEAAYNRIDGGNRNALVLGVRAGDPLREADRGIAGRDSSVPYALGGNVLPVPLFGTEIDPVLSALVADTVGIAGVPAGKSHPSLADFAVLANSPNPAALGELRTLLPAYRIYNAEASITRKIGTRTTVSLSARGEYSEEDSRQGLFGASLALPAGSPFSPFSRDVTVARFLGPTLVQDRKSGNMRFAALLDSHVGAWRLSASASWSWRKSRTLTDRGFDPAALEAGIASGTVNPFADVPASLLGAVIRDTARYVNQTANAQFTASGPLLRVPAGALKLTVRLGAGNERTHSTTPVASGPMAGRYARTEGNGQVAIDLPLVSTKSGLGLGALGLNASAGFRQVSAVGTLRDDMIGLRWNPSSRASLYGQFSEQETPPAPSVISEPIVATPAVRIYDFLRGETVSVTQLRGGNPALAAERRRTLRIGGSWDPLPRAELSLNAEYSRTRTRGAIASLPPVSAAVQLAFPERYQRDAAGVLIAVDARPVSFDHVERAQISWGVTYKRSFGHLKGTRGAASAANDDDDDGSRGARESLRSAVGGWRLIASASHTLALSNTRQARPGLPAIDLLDGGASGYGGGSPRHAVSASVSLAGHGVGLQATGAWSSGATVRAGDLPSPADLRFSSRAVFELRAFADLGVRFPNAAWAKGMRLSVTAQNLFDSKQRVVDGTGAVPVSYQPYLLDPLGRTIGFSLRKAF